MRAARLGGFRQGRSEAPGPLGNGPPASGSSRTSGVVAPATLPPVAGPRLPPISHGHGLRRSRARARTGRRRDVPPLVPRSSMSTNALVLNATYEPLCVVSSRRAVVLVLGDKAEI